MTMTLKNSKRQIANDFIALLKRDKEMLATYNAHMTMCVFDEVRKLKGVTNDQALKVANKATSFFFKTMLDKQ